MSVFNLCASLMLALRGNLELCSIEKGVNLFVLFSDLFQQNNRSFAKLSLLFTPNNDMACRVLNLCYVVTNDEHK